MRSRLLIFFLVFVGAILVMLVAPWAPRYEKGVPEPSMKGERYGEHHRQRFDLWLPADLEKGERVPLVVWFHGGGFLRGDTHKIQPRFLNGLLSRHVAVASASYRMAGKGVRFQEILNDGARAVQFLRYHAERYQIDSDRVATFGFSAGGGIALWIGTHDNLADASAADPVLRESTRVRCFGAKSSQASYDPEFFVRQTGVSCEAHPAFRHLFPNPNHARNEILQASSLAHVSADDPPAVLNHKEPMDTPIRIGDSLKDVLHHPGLMAPLKESMEQHGLKCEWVKSHADVVDFLARNLQD